MKKVHFLFFVLGMLTVSGSGQSYMTLTFTSTCRGEYVVTDSILAENVTRGCDTMVRFPDSVLILDIVSAIQDPGQAVTGFTVLQNQPNPFRDQTRFTVVIPSRQELDIHILDQTGRQVSVLNKELPAGIHSFVFRGGIDLLYFASIRAGNETRVIKMIRLAEENQGGRPDLEYLGATSPGPETKHSEKRDHFLFSIGDSIIFTGYARTQLQFRGSDLIMDCPTEDIFYEFEMLEGIPCSGNPALTYQGRLYTTRQIGGQCWIRENVDAGTQINVDTNQTDNGILEKYCYNNLSYHCTVYGGLYQWYEAMQYSNQEGAQGICPPGWHLPTDNEWSVLSDLLGGENFAGGHLKEAGYQHWYQPNTMADDSVGFNALPAGMYFDGTFRHIRTNVEYWSSTDSYGPYAWYRILYNDNAHFTRTNYFEKTTARSVRCIRDEN